MAAGSLSPYIGRYPNFRRVESRNTDQLVYRQDTSVGGRVVAAVVLVLGVGVLIDVCRVLFGVYDPQRHTVVSIVFQLLLGLLLIVIGIRNSFETATITFDKADSSVRFVRSIIFPIRPVTAMLTTLDSVTVRPSIWGGGSRWFCVYLTGVDDGTEFGVFAEPNKSTAEQKANELSSFLGLSLDPVDA